MSQSIISKTLSRTLSAPNLCNTDHSPSKRDTKMPFWKPTKSSSSSQAASDGLVDGVARQTSSASSKGKAKESSSRISKPFNTMSVEEMLDVLPSCNSEVITSAWLPQVKRDWDRIKADLEKMYNEKLRSQVTLADFKDHLSTISRGAGTISQTYQNAMRSAESLTEREHQNAKEELVELRKKVQDADQEIDGLHLTIEMNEQNFQCIWQIARPCVVFSLNLADQWSNKQTREMRQLLDDHPGPNVPLVGMPMVRVPAHTYFEGMHDGRLAKAELEDRTTTCREQSEMIAQKSAAYDNLHARATQWLGQVSEKNHEVVLLADRVNLLESKLHKNELALRQAEQDQATTDELIAGFKRQLAEADEKVTEKDSAIFKMYTDLNDAKKQLAASQNKLRDRSRSKSRRGRDAVQQTADPMPATVSSFTHEVQKLQRAARTGPSPRPEPIYKFVSHSNLPAAQQADVVSVNSSNLADPVRGQHLIDPFGIAPAFNTPPGRTKKPSPMKPAMRKMQDPDKPLPTPPFVVPTIPNTATLGRQAGSTSYSIRGPSDLPLRNYPTQDNATPERRVLSIIPEVDSARSGKTAASATSSDKDAYRTTLNALNLLDTQASPQEGESPSQGPAANQKRLRKIASEDLNAKRLYHAHPRHL